MWHNLQLVLGVLFVCSTLTNAEPHPVMEECRKIDPCRCQAESGIIDLSPLDSKNYLEPAFKDIPSVTPNDTDKFSWNPCTPFCEVHCESAAACQIQNAAAGDYFNIGRQSSAAFQMNYTYNNDNKTNTVEGLVLIYKYNDPLSPTRVWTTVIKLICNESAGNGTLIPYGEIGYHTMHYYFEFSSNYSCLWNVSVPSPEPDPTLPTCPHPWETTTTSWTTTTTTTTTPSPWLPANWDWKLWLAFGCLGAVVLVLLYFVIHLMVNLGRGKRGVAVVPHYRCFQACCCSASCRRRKEGHQRLIQNIGDIST